MIEGGESIHKPDPVFFGLSEMAASHRAVKRQASMLGMSHQIGPLGNFNDVPLTNKASDDASEMTDDFAMFILGHGHMKDPSVILFELPAPKIRRLSTMEHALEKLYQRAFVPGR